MKIITIAVVKANWIGNVGGRWYSLSGNCVANGDHEVR